MKKKVLSLMLTIALSLSLAPAVFADGAGYAVPSNGTYLDSYFSWILYDGESRVTMFISNCLKRNDLPIMGLYDETGDSVQTPGRSELFNMAYGSQFQEVKNGISPNYSDTVEFLLCTATFPRQYAVDIRISGETTVLKQGERLNGPIDGYNALGLKGIGGYYYFFYLEDRNETPAYVQAQQSAAKPSAPTAPSKTPTAPVAPAKPAATTTSTSTSVPTQRVSFTDVPSSHWASSAITACAGKGYVSGVGNNRFDPDGKLTNAQFVTMVINALYLEEAQSYENSHSGEIAQYFNYSTKWYSGKAYFALEQNLLSGMEFSNTKSATVADRGMTRYDMAQLLANTLAREGITADISAKTAAQSSIKDWNQVPLRYRDAVATCFALGFLSGFGDGSFGGTQTMTRAQACVVLMKLSEAVSSKAAEQPAVPVPSSPAPVEGDFSAEYMASKYYQALQNVTLTGNYREDILAIASSQLGYCEGNQLDQLDGSFRGRGNCTEYGRYLDSNGTAWCSEFASWCVRMAKVPTSILNSSRSASVENFDAPYYSWSETVYAGGGYMPRPGDLALFAWSGTSMTARSLSHTAIVYDVETEGDTVIITVIDGNSNNMVRKHAYTADMSDGDVGQGHLVYFVAPDYD